MRRGLRNFFEDTANLFTALGILLIFFIQIDVEKINNGATVSFFWFFSGLIIITLLILITHVSTFSIYRTRIIFVSLPLLFLTFVFFLQFISDLFLSPKGVYVLNAFKGIFKLEVLVISVPLALFLIIVYIVGLIKNRSQK